MLHNNMYFLYKIYMRMNDQEPMSHFDFNISLPLDWIDIDYYWPNKKQIYQDGSRNNESTSKTRTS